MSCGDDEPQYGKDTVVDLSNATETNYGYYDGLLYFKLISYDEATVTKCNTEAVDVQIPAKVKLNGNTYSVRIIGPEAFYWCTGLQNVDIPNTVTNIGFEAFYNCYSLENVNIGNSVTTIGELAFYNCSRLKNIKCSNPTPPSFDYANSGFGNYVYNNATLYVPMSSVETYKSADVWCYFKNIEGI